MVYFNPCLGIEDCCNFTPWYEPGTPWVWNNSEYDYDNGDVSCCVEVEPYYLRNHFVDPETENGIPVHQWPVQDIRDVVNNRLVGALPFFTKVLDQNCTD